MFRISLVAKTLEKKGGLSTASHFFQFFLGDPEFVNFVSMRVYDVNGACDTWVE